jgi:threonine/homoserine/homoserine lactone efflux protein
LISTLLIFIFSCLVSFVGSLQLGPVNVFVINSALYQGKKIAYLVAIGGCIPEFIYCALAVYANNYLLEYDWLIFLFKLAFIIILIIVGFTFYFKKQSILTAKKQTVFKTQPLQHIFKGFSLAILNPQLLPFWMFVQVYFNSISFLPVQSNPQKISYIFGSGVGAFILLGFFIFIVLKHREKILNYVNHKYYFKALSLLLFAIAGHQIWLLVNS